MKWILSFVLLTTLTVHAKSMGGFHKDLNQDIAEQTWDDSAKYQNRKPASIDITVDENAIDQEFDYVDAQRDYKPRHTTKSGQVYDF